MVDDDLLELRVHGVNNTPPTSLLYAIQEEYGDSLVGVYGERSDAGLVRALSWGGLARMSPIPRIPFAGWAQSVGSAAWIFVVPFGLANVAYWSRHLTMPGKKFEKGTRVTAALARVFSLGLTLLLASSVCSVSLDMTDSRVVSDDPPPPTWLHWLRDLEPGCRMALLSAAPLLAMTLLFALARWSSVRYDWGSRLSASAPNQLATPGFARRDVWKFGDREFWDNADLSKHNAAVHTAAGVALTSIWTGQIWFTDHHRVGLAVVSVSLVIIFGCGLLIAFMPLVTEGKAIGKKRKALTWLVFSASLAMFAAQFFALVVWHSALKPNPMAGLSFIPGALVFILLVLAVSALGWRWWRQFSYVVTAVPLLLGAVVLVLHQWKLVGGDELKVVDGLLVAVLVVLAVGWVLWLYRRNAPHAEEAWRGTAPGLLMVLALFAGVLLSTVFVMVAAALLGDGNIRINDTELSTAPPIYLSFASMLVPVLVVLVLLIVGVLARIVFFCRTPIESELDKTTQPDAQRMARLAVIFDAQRFARLAPKFCKKCHTSQWARSIRSCRWWRIPSVRCRKRRLAAAAHRAEPMAAVLAAVAGLAICGSLVLGLMLHNGVVPENAPILSIAWKLGAGGAALIGAAVAAKGARRGRPLGIVWDLICFLPRAAHPFGPPCYAQRAVPELLNYCRAWLDTPTAGGNPKPRKLILSAHSLGGVLAVAIVLLLADTYNTRIALVTYGCQLRAYFGRIFPELLGPRILGVTNSRPARLFGCPTFGEPPLSASDSCPPSVRETLTGECGGPRWINLWRPTDYLGFPVYSRAPNNPIDRPADEVTAEKSVDGKIVLQKSAADIQTLDSPVPMDEPVRFASTTTVRVDTHSDYFRARQYPSAISDLKTRLGAAPQS